MRNIFVFLILLPFAVNAQLSKEKVMYFDSLFRSYFKTHEPGGAVLIAREGKIIYTGAFGIADVHARDAITTKTLFNTGSISKTFVAYGILKLASQNKLSLADDLYSYFPDFKNKAIAQKVKLYHLLTHTSGIPDTRRVKEEHTFYLTAKDEENWHICSLNTDIKSIPVYLFLFDFLSISI